MSQIVDLPDFNALIPTLCAWNGGKGVPPEVWIGAEGNFPLAVGYSLVFWPRFSVFEDYVLRDGFSVDSLRGFEKSTGHNRRAVEGVLNHLHIADLHDTEVNEQQLLYLGRILRQIHQVKLCADFPDRRFEVVFNDNPDQHPADYQITFYQL